MQCRLCQWSSTEPFYLDSRRNWSYFLCKRCDFVFRDPETYLDPVTEKKRYSTHNNSLENLGYVNFLKPIVDVVVPHLNKSDRGLDFGSGPGPILDQLFAAKGFVVENYDPFFAPSVELLNKSYDFVTCTEAFEHFYQPNREMALMSRLLKPGGYLILMSEWRKEDFATWYYRNDETHVAFLNQKSLQWLCEHWGFHLLRCMDRIALLRKHEGE